jgi:hypothetical protein
MEVAQEGGTGPEPEPCSTVNVCPAIRISPLRALPDERATLNATVPPPTPVAPDVIEIQEAELVAVHSHGDAVATATLSDPPCESNAAEL